VIQLRLTSSSMYACSLQAAALMATTTVTRTGTDEMQPGMCGVWVRAESMCLQPWGVMMIVC